MKPREWDQLARDVLAGLEASHLSRRRRLVHPIDATHVLCDGQPLINFASNDYLGLTHHPAVLQAIERSLHEMRWKRCIGADQRLRAGGRESRTAHRAVEGMRGSHPGPQRISGQPRGSAGAGRRRREMVSISSDLLDKLCHASLIDAVRAAGASWRIFPHNHLPKLQRLLANADPQELQIVVTESIFSMDGDAADLPGLARLKEEYPFVLLLDEAHASGVYGPAGKGRPPSFPCAASLTSPS